MKYFTPARHLALQDFSSDEAMDAAYEAWEAEVERYEAYLQTIRVDLPAEVLRLLEGYYLHDARVLSMGLPRVQAAGGDVGVSAHHLMRDEARRHNVYTGSAKASVLARFSAGFVKFWQGLYNVAASPRARSAPHMEQPPRCVRTDSPL